MSMIRTQSRTWLSQTQPTAPLRFATVDINSPQGALVPAWSAECTITSPGPSESTASISGP